MRRNRFTEDRRVRKYFAETPVLFNSRDEEKLAGREQRERDKACPRLPLAESFEVLNPAWGISGERYSSPTDKLASSQARRISRGKGKIFYLLFKA